MLFDAHVHLGSWPFAFLPNYSAPQLAAHLKAHGIGRAAVSPLDAVLAPDPLPANRALLAAVRKTPGLLPLPAVNPALAHWREQLDLAAAAPLRAIKLYPNYHNWRLDAPRFAPFFAEVAARGLRVVIGARLEDERHRYFALRIKGVPVKSLAAFLKKYPKLDPLILGLYLPELRELAKAAKNFSADMSCVEWIRSAETLAKEFPHDRICFGSHTPFFNTRASVDKITTATLPAKVRTAFGHANAERFFGL